MRIEKKIDKYLTKTNLSKEKIKEVYERTILGEANTTALSKNLSKSIEKEITNILNKLFKSGKLEKYGPDDGLNALKIAIENLDIEDLWWNLVDKWFDEM